MSLRFFTIPALDPDPAQQAFDAFCQANRVVQVERQFVADGSASYWALCATVAEGAGPLPTRLKKPSTSAAPAANERVDYKQVLSADDFTLYAALRQWRKETAEREGVPLYAVFSNEQLAQFATRRCGSLDDLSDIDGVGPARVNKYGHEVLKFVVATP